MKRTITDIKSAEEVFEHFNHFHDGLLKRISIISRDEIQNDKSQLCTGLFDIECEIHHYNYDLGRPPYNRRVKLRFNNAQQFYFDLSGMDETGWVIFDMSVVEEPNQWLGFYMSRVGTDKHKLFSFKDAVVEDYDS